MSFDSSVGVWGWGVRAEANSSQGPGEAPWSWWGLNAPGGLVSMGSGCELASFSCFRLNEWIVPLFFTCSHKTDGYFFLASSTSEISDLGWAKLPGEEQTYIFFNNN